MNVVTKNRPKQLLILTVPASVQAADVPYSRLQKRSRCYLEVLVIEIGQ